MSSTEQGFGADPLDLSQKSFAAFATFITGELGIKMPGEKVTMLKSRLLRRLRDLGLNSLEDYRKYLFESPNSQDELVHFVDAVTTNKTDFFREPQHFDFLSNTVLPEFSRQRQNRQFKLWCAGCSSGEEPYSQSMVLSEYRKRAEGFDFAILATDVSTRVLAHAQNGVYDLARVEPIPEELKKSYLLRSKNPAQKVVRIVPELRRRISFHRLNFMDANYGVSTIFDVIFFRNVMIYFDKMTQEAVINKLCKNLKPGGYLFVGHSESLAGLNVPVAPVASAVFRKAR